MGKSEEWCKRKAVEEGSWMLWEEEMRELGAAAFLFLSEREKRNLY